MTVLFSDLCDYTRLNESSDPEDADQVRCEAEDLMLGVIRKHGGAVSQVYGDGVLAVFGLPQPQENDARRAIEAALELHALIEDRQWQAKLPPDFKVQLHSGVHAGLVFARRGDALHGTYELTGDPVVTASRLCAAAARGEILASASALSGSEAFFASEPMSDLTLRGKRLPVTAHRVTGHSGVRTRFEGRARRGLTQLVGRDAERTILTQTLATGGLVLLTGAPGIGKSRLLEELGLEAAARGIPSLRGTCESYGEISPLEPFVQVLRQLFGVAALSVQDAIATITAHVGTWGAHMQSQLPTLLQLLSLQPWPAEAAESNTLAVQALCEVIDTLTKADRLCLILDDWHWADDNSRQVLQRISREVDRARLAIVVASRPSEDLGSFAEHATWVSVLPLAADDAERMVNAVLSSELDLGVQRAIRQRAGGNPLFIEELCRALPRDARGQAVLDGQVPSTLHEAIQARLALLPETTARMLRVASVMGQEFSEELFARALGVEPLQGDGEGLAGDLLVPGQEPKSLRFKHGIIRDVIYESVRNAERRQTHRQIAELIEVAVAAGQLADQSEALTHHYVGCGDIERAATHAELAGHKAAASSALDRARLQYHTALEQLAQLPASTEVRRRWLQNCMKWALFCAYNPAWSCLPILEQAVVYAAELQDETAQSIAEYWLGWQYHVLGQQQDALAHYEQAKRLVDPNKHPKLMAQLLAAFGQTYVAAGAYPEALDCLTRGLALKRPSDTGVKRRAIAQGFTYALGCKAIMHADLGQFSEAERDLDEALEGVRDSGHAIEASILSLRQMALIWRGDFTRSLATIDAHRRTAERLHAAYVFAMSHVFEGYSSYMLERKPDALRQMRDAIDWLDARKIGLFISFSYGCLAHALALADDASGARELAQRALDRAQESDLFGEAIAYRVLARLAGPNLAEAQAQLDQASRAAERRHSRRELLVTQLEHADLWTRAGRSAEGRESAALVQGELTELGMFWHAEHARALAAGDQSAV